MLPKKIQVTISSEAFNLKKQKEKFLSESRVRFGIMLSCIYTGDFLTVVLKVLENCNQVKVSLLTKKLLEVKYKVLTKKST